MIYNVSLRSYAILIRMNGGARQPVDHGGGKTGKRNCLCDLCRPLKNKYASDARKARGSRSSEATKYKYGITDDELNALRAQQNDRCVMCNNVFIDRRSIRVDHDHQCCRGIKTCGKCVRGLLCHKCNIQIAIFDNPELFKKATDYLGLRSVQMA